MFDSNYYIIDFLLLITILKIYIFYFLFINIYYIFVAYKQIL